MGIVIDRDTGLAIYTASGGNSGGGTGGGSTAYYKCASVDTANSKWAGYKLVKREDGIHEIDTAISSGLSYTLSPPTVGKIYSEDAVVEVAYIPVDTGIPEDNLLVYLVGDSFSDASGNGIGIDNWANRVGLMEHDGFKCFYKAGDDACLKCINLNYEMSAGDNRSYSVKMCIPQEPSSDVEYQVVRLDHLGNTILDNIYLNYNSSEKKWFLNNCGYDGAVTTEVSIEYGKWFHVGGTVEFTSGDRATIKQYFNGINTGTRNEVYMSTWWEWGYCFLFRGDEVQPYRQFTGYLCKFRMYKDVLTADEMRGLAKEV